MPAAGLFLLLNRLMDRLRLYRFVWHPALFGTAVFVLVLTGVTAGLDWWLAR